MDSNDKDRFFQPSSPQGPVIMQPSDQPQPQDRSQPASSPAASSKGGSRNKLILFAAIGGGVLLLLIVLLVALASQKPVEQPTQQTPDQTKNLSIEPANALDIEQINNSINQEIGTLNDEKQLPKEALGDKSIGL